MSLLDKNHFNSFLKGFKSVLDLYPQLELPEVVESNVVVPGDDFESLSGDWEKIKQDLEGFLRNEEPTE